MIFITEISFEQQQQKINAHIELGLFVHDPLATPSNQPTNSFGGISKINWKAVLK